MSNQKRKAHFNVFFREVGHHRNAWRLPETTPEREFDYAFYVNLARIAERGLLDCVFMADGYVGTFRRLEPFTLLSAIAVLTERIGLIATAGTTYNEPFHIARKNGFAGLYQQGTRGLERRYGPYGGNCSQFRPTAASGPS